MEAKLKKYILNVGKAVREKPGSGGYDLADLQQVELKAELLANSSLYRGQDGKLMLHVIDYPGEGRVMNFQLFEVTVKEVEEQFPKVTWLRGTKFSSN
jgi:hypothetical protein